MGKKLLVKPLAGQPEQMSNALALQQLGLGHAMNSLDKKTLADWLEKSNARKITYPDTATAIANWIDAGDWKDTSALTKQLWQQVKGFEI